MSPFCHISLADSCSALVEDIVFGSLLWLPALFASTGVGSSRSVLDISFLLSAFSPWKTDCVHGVSRTQLPCWHVLTHDCIDFQWRFVVKCSHAGPRTDPCKPDISVVSANTLTVRWGLSQTFITPCAWLTHRYPATTGNSRWPTFCERYHRHGNRPRALLAHRRQLSANLIGGSRRISVPFPRIFAGSHPNSSAARLLCMPTVTEITSRETGRVCPIGTITHGRVI